MVLRWSYASMILYLIMGIIGYLCLSRAGNMPKLCIYKFKISSSYFLLFVIWGIFAVYRYISYPIGGADAEAYVRYFDNCFNPSGIWQTEHMDVLYAFLNKAIRTVTDDYHILFWIVYGIMILSYLFFFETFKVNKFKYYPFAILVYIYIRGFNTIRTNLGVAFILFAIVCCYKEKYIESILFAIGACFFQVGSILYAPFLLFYLLTKKYKNQRRVLICFFGLSVILSILARYVILNYNISILEHGSYRYYAQMNMGKSFFSNYWKIALPQLLMLFPLVGLRKKLVTDIALRENQDQRKLYFLISLITYDVLTIAPSFILGVWRAYEYLYIARLLMWSWVITIYYRKMSNSSSRKLLWLCSMAVFLGWMTFRQYNTWEDSCLMPYYFEPILSILRLI